MTISDIRFNPTTDPLAYRVAKSDRLLAMVHADELDPLITHYRAAKKAADDAAAITFQPDDLRAQVRRNIAAGVDVDVDAVMTALAQNQAAKAAHDEARQFFAALPDGYRMDIAGLLRDSLPDFYDGLAAQLDELLDRATTVVDGLEGAYDAEKALDAGKAGEFVAFRTLAADYADLRAAHQDVLICDGGADSFGTGSDTLAFAYWGDIAAGHPAFIRAAREGTHDGAMRRYADEPFPITDPASRDHFLAAVLSREVLKPRVATAAEASAARTLAARADWDAGAAGHTPGGDVIAEYGTAQRAMSRMSRY